ERQHALAHADQPNPVGPRGLPPAIAATLHDALRRALFDPAHLAELAKYDKEPAYLSPVDYARACREAFLRERAIVERLGLLRQES
ncbi:MAG: tripartite tricarboxylate transporter substrate-binding protein, partial [Burkholderiaceae bacterium]|nr:tripartite tricarboxylate transporter substrate-binding protein [Burkholderiaceae bacterium]